MPALMSVFTPTHRLDYLLDAYESLKTQTYPHFEWVLVPNNGGRIPYEIQQDPRVRIVQAPADMKGIGALKRFACEQCLGDYFVELDHDDMLREDALEKIAAAAAETHAGFLYSDNVDFFPNWSCRRFGSQFNWESYATEWRGRQLTALRAFDPSPASLRRIEYAPNHVRVWAREAYNLAGGHDAGLVVCDDLDLMSRTYVSGVKFAHIPECLYFYRLQPDGRRTNSWLELNDELVKLNDKHMRNMTQPLIDEWCRRNQLQRLDMGGGINPTPGYTSIDMRDADILCDVGFEPLPIADNSVGMIRCHDFLEHIPPCNRNCAKHGEHVGCPVAVMNDFYRVLAPGGWLRIKVPSTDGRGAWQDPSHVSGWNSNSFWYYTKREQAKFIRGLECRYMSQHIENCFPSEWHKTHDILYTLTDLVALKGQRTPGLDQI